MGTLTCITRMAEDKSALIWLSVHVLGSLHLKVIHITARTPHEVSYLDEGFRKVSTTAGVKCIQAQVT